RLETCEQTDKVSIECAHGIVRGERNRHPQLHIGIWKLEVPRHHTHNRVEFAIEVECLSENILSPAKTTFPQFVAQEGNAMLPECAFLFRKGSPHRRVHAE